MKEKVNWISVILIAGLMLITTFSERLGWAKEKIKEQSEVVPEEVKRIVVHQSGDTVAIENEKVKVGVNVASGKVDLLWKHNSKPMIRNAVAGALMDGGWIYTPDYQEKTWQEKIVKTELGWGKCIEISFKSLERPQLIETIALYPDGGYVILQLVMVNTLPSSIQINAMRPLEVNPDYGGGLDFDLPEATILALINGYQSWDYAGVIKIARSALNAGIGGESNKLYITNTSSWWSQALYDELSGNGLVAGALTARKWKTTLHYEVTHLKSRWYTQCGDGEKIFLAPGERLNSEYIWVQSSGSNINDLGDYGVCIKKMNNVERVFAPPKGWCSWYYYFDAVTEEDVLSNARTIKEKLGNVGYEYIQIDDGWQGLWGDWRPNEKFPDGMNGTASKIHDLGFKAGIWLAPFLMNQNLPPAKEHPDWFLKDENGNYITYSADDGSAHLCLDATHPGARQWLYDLFRKVREWGYDYIKIDFLFAGAYEGVRYDRNKTGTEALRIGLKTIREAFGEDRYILGCGAPMLPGIGILDGNRIGADICYGVVVGGSPYGIMNWLQLVWECRNIAARYFLGGCAYHNDPDVIIVREPYTMDEARTLTTACILSGGVTMLSDNLPELSEERLALLNDPEVYGLIQGKSAIPVDLFEHSDLPLAVMALGTLQHLTFGQVPQIWYLPIDNKTCAVGLFNWGNLPTQITLDFSRIDRGEGKYKLYDMWEKKDLGEYSGSYSVALLPHACQLLKIVG